MARMPNGARNRGIGDGLGQVGVKRDQFAAAADDRRGHSHDVVVIETDYPELD
jgi:hypothetical protein